MVTVRDFLEILNVCILISPLLSLANSIYNDPEHSIDPIPIHTNWRTESYCVVSSVLGQDEDRMEEE